MKRIGTIACSLLIVVAAARAADECKNILGDGIRDTFKKSDFTRIDQSIKKYLNMSHEQLENEKRKVSQTADLSIDLPIIDSLLDVGADWSNTKEEEKYKYVHDKLQSHLESQFRKDVSIDEFVSVANKEIVSAWKICMGRKAKGLLTEENISKDSIVLTLHWVPPGRQYPTKITSVSLTNAVSKAEVKGELDAAGRSFQFARPDPFHESIIIIQTEDGPSVSIAEAYPHEDEAAKVLERRQAAQLAQAKAVIRFQGNAIAQGRKVAATQAVFSDRIRVVWQPVDQPNMTNYGVYGAFTDSDSDAYYKRDFFFTVDKNTTIFDLTAELINSRKNAHWKKYEDKPFAFEPGRVCKIYVTRFFPTPQGPNDRNLTDTPVVGTTAAP